MPRGVAWRAALVLVVPLGLPACPGPRMDPVGLSTVRAAGGASSPADASVPGPPSPVPADFREHMIRLVARQLSRGHGEKFDGVVWGNDAASAAWRALGSMPDGAVLVEEAIERAAKGDRADGVLFMERAAGAWRFVAVGADGEVAADDRTRACATCHAEAPRDGVFRLADQSSTSATSAATTASVPTAVATTAATVDARKAGAADAASSP